MGRNYFRGAFSKDSKKRTITMSFSPGGKEEIDARFGSFQNMLSNVTETGTPAAIPVEALTTTIDTEDGIKKLEESYPLLAVFGPPYETFSFNIQTEFDTDFEWTFQRIENGEEIISRSVNKCPVKLEIRSFDGNDEVSVNYSILPPSEYTTYELAHALSAFLALLNNLSKNAAIPDQLKLFKDFWCKLYAIEQSIPETKFSLLRIPSEIDMENLNLIYYSIVKNRVIRQNNYPSSLTVTFDTEENLNNFIEEINNNTLMFAYSLNPEIDIAGQKLKIFARCFVFNVVPKPELTDKNQVTLALESRDNLQPFIAYKYSLSNVDDVDSVDIKLYQDAKSLEELKAENDDNNMT